MTGQAIERSPAAEIFAALRGDETPPVLYSSGSSEEPHPYRATERSRRRRRTCSAVITNAALCAECLAKKINVPADRVKMTLMRISKTLNVTNAGAGCDACRTSTKVFRLA